MENLKITLSPTPRMVRLNGEPAREWMGFDDKGVPVMALIRSVSPQTHDEETNARYARALKELGFAEAAPITIDMRHII